MLNSKGLSLVFEGKMAGRPKGSKNRRTILKEQAAESVMAADPEFDPYLYIMSVGKDPSKWDEKRAWAASELMPYKYPRLSAAKIDADVNAKINVVELDKSGGRNG